MVDFTWVQIKTRIFHKYIHSNVLRGILGGFLLELQFNTKAAIEYVRIRSALEKKGTPIGSLDMLPAAHAKSVGALLVTNKVKEFNRVFGLLTQNWVKE